MQSGSKASLTRSTTRLPREEKIANAYLLRSVRYSWPFMHIKGRNDALRRFMTGQPTGYREGGEITETRRFSAECATLGGDYWESIDGPTADWLSAVFVTSLLAWIPDHIWHLCPTLFVHDEAQFGLPPLELDLFPRVEHLVESPAFLSAIGRLQASVQKKWAKVRSYLSTGIPAHGLDFKLWKRNEDRAVYSVRLSSSHRIHLEHDPSSQTWCAVAVGSHKAMGHG